jgi:hypothetical protein
MVKIVALVQKADDVFSQAESIIANVPTNEADASAMASPDGPGGRFYAAERDLQNAVGAIPPTGELTSQFSQGTVRLGQFDNFVYNAVSDALGTCDGPVARAGLRVAREILARRASSNRARKGQPELGPPSLNDIPDANGQRLVGSGAIGLPRP